MPILMEKEADQMLASLLRLSTKLNELTRQFEKLQAEFYEIVTGDVAGHDGDHDAA